VAAKPPLMGDYTSQYIGDYPWNWEIPFNQPERWNDIGKLNTAQMKIDKFTDKNGINRDLSQQDHLAPSRSPLQPCSIHGPHGLYVLKNTDASDMNGIMIPIFLVIVSACFGVCSSDDVPEVQCFAAG